ncbi:MAG: hypothetical protein VB075_05275 [Petrimonas sp.]|jgi:hypothetical protein|uniref:hypothetical protein n=1 Tax=Petrimonas sp. TaxID=2023866 RepID=UPI002B3930BF|nr:hypothetical protein [Petrimonas sp.]MEA4996464.1 hypothetical protein [Petrimonas sp.]MEA5043974.1 hypothetical protein [Petrimonas sp.]
MDTIIFDSPFNKETFIHSNKVFWDYTWEKNKKQIKNFLISFIILLGLGLLTRANHGANNPFVIASIFSLCIAGLIGLLRFFSWRRHDRIMKEVADEYENVNSEFAFEIFEEAFRFSDFQKKLELKWSAFSHYTIYKGYIILVPKHSFSGAFLFDTNDESEAEKYQQTLKIIKDKLKYIET